MLPSLEIQTILFMPSDASKMFGKNVVNFLKLIIGEEGEFELELEEYYWQTHASHIMEK